MKYDNVRAFEKHLESASPQHFAGIYLILGKEPVEIKEATDLLLRHLLPQGRDLGLYIFEGPSSTASEILTELNSISFLAQKRVIWIQQADKLKKEVQESLETYMNRPPRQTFLILTATTLHKGSTFYKKCEKAGVVLEIPELKPWEKEKRVTEWLSKKAVEARKVMSHQVCQFLVKQMGSDQALLVQEFEKLLCYIGDRGEITFQDVGTICTSLNVESVWQLGESIFRFNTPSAVHICQGLLNEGNALLPLLRQIRSQFQTGYQIGTILAQGGKASDIMQEYPYMKGQILERNIQQAQQYGLEKYRQGLLALDEAEMQSKSSQMEDDLLAELLMIKLSARGLGS